MARLVAAALALAMIAACGAGRDRGPAWPTRTEPETDGGESLAPRTATFVAASEEKKKEPAKDEDKKTETKADEVKATDKPAATTDTKATTPASTDDDVIIIDDIVIEIDD